MSRILVTGVSGFAGPGIAARLAEARHAIVAAGRSPPPPEARADRFVPVGEQGPLTDWTAALADIEVVVHLAGHAHAESRSPEARRLIHAVNVEGTERLARQAAAHGVRRFVFMSSIKVHGEESPPGRPHCADDAPRPGDPYGESKAEAERRLRAVAAETGLELVIIRPPLLLGPRSKANVARLVQLVRSGLPLPFASIRNRRSLLSLPNLADLVAISIDHPRAIALPLLAADADAPSTPELVHWVAEALGRRARLFAFPPALLEAGAMPLGLRGMVTRLTRSQELDAAMTVAATGWKPTMPTASAVRTMLIGAAIR